MLVPFCAQHIMRLLHKQGMLTAHCMARNVSIAHSTIVVPVAHPSSRRACSKHPRSQTPIVSFECQVAEQQLKHVGCCCDASIWSLCQEHCCVLRAPEVMMLMDWCITHYTTAVALPHTYTK